MSTKLKQQHNNMPDAYSIVTHLQELYGEQSQSARYEISKAIFRAKMSPRGSDGDYVLKMIAWMDKLKELDVPMHQYLQINAILQSLSDSFRSFISNFYMNNIECSLTELMYMLIITQGNMETGTVMAVSSSSKTKKGKGKKKATQATKGINKKKGKTIAKGKCFHYGKDGY
ncbi:uncharacterized protein LOC127799719 [Diospyros lotus]|uniref:uncharacterized protein LOC127799719 n=1 Tax=Diospyros lotus TaxID=55363 RepID=UPI00224FEF08|nr:uncharacterized protein LOC127799719 [Diospyros lotus]